MQYIHYGHKEYNANLFVEPVNKEMFNKPIGGLWASSLEAPFGWKQWCTAENYCVCNDDNAFIFELSKNANIYQINCKTDIEKLPLIQSIIHTPWLCPDFETIKKSGIDVIQYNLSNDTTKNWCDSLYFALYGWDCDCILVLNKNVIKPL